MNIYRGLEAVLSNVADHLQGPRRKKREFVFFAFGGGFDRGLYREIDSYFHQKHPSFYYARPKNPGDFNRMAGRKMLVMMIDDSFNGINGNIDVVRAIKERAGSEAAPIIFFTQDRDALILEYNRRLKFYQESDSYIEYSNLNKAQIFDRIDRVLMTMNTGRKSRRYRVNMEIEFGLFGVERKMPVRLIDLSMHGAQIEFAEPQEYHPGQQLRVRVPLTRNGYQQSGEFLLLSGKFRRVFLNGRRFGVSWEHLSAKQHMMLTDFLFKLVAAQEVK